MSGRRTTWHLGSAVTLGFILAVAVVLRLVKLRAGLPGPGLSPDENTVVPIAMRMLHDGTLNPDWFLYPSLYFTLTAGVIALARPVVEWPAGIDFASVEAFAADPTPYIMSGRLISLVAGVAVVAGVWLLARRVGDVLTAIVAATLSAVAPVLVSYSHIAVTDMLMLALLTFGLWQLAVATAERSRRSLIVAGLLIGLAASAKYNAGFAVLPLLGVAWWIGRGRLTATAGGAALGGFLAGTPFALLDPGTFWSDFFRQNRIVADGWLGFENAGPGWWFNLNPVLWDAVGPVALIAAAIGIIWGAIRRDRIDWVLIPFAIAFFVYVSLWNAHFDRYVLPIVPVLAVFAGEGIRALGETIARRWPRALPAIAGIGVVFIATPALIESLNLLDRYGKPELRERAVTDIARLVSRGEAIAAEPLTVRLRDATVGPRLERAGVPGEWYRVTRLDTPQPGRPPDPKRDVSTLRSAGVRWVLTSDDIERRIRAASTQYPAEIRFYEQLEDEARRTLTIPASLGPGVKLWELPPPT